MIFIVVKYDVKPEAIPTFLEETKAFTEATRAEPGNMWFEWYMSVEAGEENVFLLVEAFKDGEAGSAHVSSQHFADGLASMRPLLAHTPQIVSQSIDGLDGWQAMGELVID
ncbi:MAG: antibiotic biosynthesis monooxygenase [Propionibacteriaceae bacterium]|jgi:quinol monooxygenase YgiN|nr:antibiotic biosynthesis monooxygenase [Propionibacteriaceae bacterium]